MYIFNPYSAWSTLHIGMNTYLFKVSAFTNQAKYEWNTLCSSTPRVINALGVPGCVGGNPKLCVGGVILTPTPCPDGFRLDPVATPRRVNPINCGSTRLYI